MNGILETLQGAWTPEMLPRLLQAGTQILLGCLVAWLVSRILGRVLGVRLESGRVRLLRRIAYYGILLAFVSAALASIGLPIGGVVLGTGGVLAVAVGFASQTSLSNVVSGLFLVGERSFDVGDVITTGSTTGEVLSVDLLSVKLRTFDNIYVRIPNEALLKSEVRTLTRFPIRRVDLDLEVAAGEDLARVRAILLGVADAHPLCLDEPPPQVSVQGVDAGAVRLLFVAWAVQSEQSAVRSDLLAAIRAAFAEASVILPSQRFVLTDARGGEAPPREGAAEEGGE